MSDWERFAVGFIAAMLWGILVGALTARSDLSIVPRIFIWAGVSLMTLSLVSVALSKNG